VTHIRTESNGKTSDDTRQVWVFIEQEGGTVAPVSLELVSKARELADDLDGQVAALLLGEDVADLAQSLMHQGADKVFLSEHQELAVYRTLPYARVIIDLIEEHHPYIVLFGATPLGRDLAPRIASATSAGLTADCTALEIGDLKRRGETYEDLLFQIRPAFGGNIVATIINPEMHPQMATVREGVMHIADPDPTRTGEVVRVTPEFRPEDLVLEVLDRQMRLPKVDLKHANVIVAGGVGVGSRENWKLIEELAEVLGAEVAATRAAVDAGWVSAEHQVGQTGVTVRPRLYIAAGISGAVQHRAGMDESGTIIAINTDPNAPIFDIAHYKIVGDIRTVIPEMIRAYREEAG
jgi:electron transfer flavoprotein alpha subunit